MSHAHVKSDSEDSSEAESMESNDLTGPPAAVPQTRKRTRSEAEAGEEVAQKGDDCGKFWVTNMDGSLFSYSFLSIMPKRKGRMKENIKNKQNLIVDKYVIYTVAIFN